MSSRIQTPKLIWWKSSSFNSKGRGNRRKMRIFLGWSTISGQAWIMQPIHFAAMALSSLFPHFAQIWASTSNESLDTPGTKPQSSFDGNHLHFSSKRWGCQRKMWIFQGVRSSLDQWHSFQVNYVALHLCWVVNRCHFNCWWYWWVKIAGSMLIGFQWKLDLPTWKVSTPLGSLLQAALLVNDLILEAVEMPFLGEL